MTTKNTAPVNHMTRDYKLFKPLEGNRGVLEIRKRKVRISIESYGYIPVPIVVNERYEIIDGQARYEVCKELGLPICYCVIPGLGIEECIGLNATQTNWTMTDYINSYAVLGNENYIRLKMVMEQYPNLKLSVVGSLAYQVITGVDTKVIKDGSFEFPECRVSEVLNMCKWLNDNVFPIKNSIKGRFDMLCQAVCFALEHTDANADRLIKVIQENAARFAPIATTLQALEEIERFYNFNIKKAKVYFSTIYDQYNCDTNRGYKERWSKERGSVVVKMEQKQNRPGCEAANTSEAACQKRR